MALFGKKRQESDTQSDLASPTVTLKDGSNVQADRTVDCIGDSCPRPQLMTRKALREAAAGEIVVIVICSSETWIAVITVIAVVRMVFRSITC